LRSFTIYITIIASKYKNRKRKRKQCYFPKYVEENPDMQFIIYGKDAEFHNWCLRLFEQYLEKADEFDENRISKI
jgi:hypothetical protein